MMESMIFWELMGRFTVVGIWWAIVGVTLWKSIRRKQVKWTIGLIINLLAGSLLPFFIVIWPPVIYLLTSKKKKVESTRNETKHKL